MVKGRHAYRETGSRNKDTGNTSQTEPKDYSEQTGFYVSTLGATLLVGGQQLTHSGGRGELCPPIGGYDNSDRKYNKSMSKGYS